MTEYTLRRVLIKLLPLFMALVLVPMVAGMAEAATFMSGTDVNITRPIQDDLYVSGAAVTIGSEVEGTVMAVGQDVYIIGDVKGDVFAAGETVVIEGTVDGSVRAAANKVIVSGNVTGDVVTGASNFELGPRGHIGRDAILGVNSGVIKGKVGRKLSAGANKLLIDGPVGGDVKIHGEKLTLGRDARLGGDIEFTGPRQASFLPGSRVKGRKAFHLRAGEDEPEFMSVFALWIWSFLSSLLVALIIALAAPRFLVRGRDAVAGKPVVTILLGLAFLLATPIVVVLVAFMTMTLALPIAAITMALYLLVLYLSSIMTAAVLGRWLLAGVAHKEGVSVLASTVTGMVLLWAVYLVGSVVPYLGGAVMAAATVVGAGAILSGQSTFYRAAREAELL